MSKDKELFNVMQKENLIKFVSLTLYGVICLFMSVLCFFVGDDNMSVNFISYFLDFHRVTALSDI